MEGKRVAVVTGANRGIGLGICRELAKLGNYVTILTSRSEDEGREALAALQTDAVGVLDYHQLDVSSDVSVEEFKAYVDLKYGRVDVLVNNAGNFISGSVLNIPIKEFQDVINVHVTGALRTTQAFLPLMKKHGYGRIINLSSGVGQLSMLTGGNMPGAYLSYAVAKLALHGLTLMSAQEVAPEEDILINALLPGFVRTSMSHQAGVPEGLPEQLGTRWRAPEEVGQDIVHLLSQSGKDAPRAKLLLQGKELPW